MIGYLIVEKDTMPKVDVIGYFLSHLMMKNEEISYMKLRKEISSFFDMDYINKFSLFGKIISIN